MDKLIVEDIVIKENSIKYKYKKEGKWAELLTDEDLFAQYEIDISTVPKSVLIIPFLCNVLPISFVFNLQINVEEIDKEFYNSIEKIKEGYQKMYPTLKMGGIVNSKKIISNNYQEIRSGALFSGGVDAFNTLFQHMEEKPTLLTVWGADIKLDDKEGWNKVKEYNIKVAKELELDYSFVKSNFKTILNYGMLSKYVLKLVNDEWWHGFQHGIGLLGLMAPISYAKCFGKVYIASSFTAKYWGKYTCASDPVIDNNLKYASCITVHDGYEFNRQDKIRNICNYKKNKNIKSIPIRVCWESKGGENCCECEKCTRTILGIIAEKEDPNKYGFDLTDSRKERIKHNIKKYAKYNFRYQCIQDEFIKNFSYEETPEFLIGFRNLKIKDKKPIYILTMEKIIRKLKKIMKKILGRL